MSYTILSKDVNSFGELVIKLEIEGDYTELTFQEGQWPTTKELRNEIRHLFSGNEEACYE